MLRFSNFSAKLGSSEKKRTIFISSSFSSETYDPFYCENERALIPSSFTPTHKCEGAVGSIAKMMALQLQVICIQKRGVSSAGKMKTP